MNWMKLTFCCHLFVTSVRTHLVQSLNPEQGLINHLMMNYSPAVRPVLNPENPVVVNLSFNIGFIIAFNEKEQVRNVH